MMKVFLGTRSLRTMNPAPVVLAQIDVQLNCSPQACVHFAKKFELNEFLFFLSTLLVVRVTICLA